MNCKKCADYLLHNPIIDHAEVERSIALLAAAGLVNQDKIIKGVGIRDYSYYGTDTDR